MGALSSVHPLESGGRTRRFGLVVGGHGRNFGQRLRWAGQSTIHHTAFPQGQKEVGVAKFGIHLVEFACNAFPPVLLKSLGVLLSQILRGVTNVREKFKE